MGENTPSNAPGVAPVKSEFLLQDHIRELDLAYVAVKDKKKVTPDEEEISEGPPRKKLKGQNKHRPREKRTPKSEKLCFKIGTDGFCAYGDNCCYSHDVNAYLDKKPPDIGEKCYLYETFGKCPYSFSCRFASEHIKDGKNLVMSELWDVAKNKSFCLNNLQRDVQLALRRHDYDFKKSQDAMDKFNLICSEKYSYNAKNLSDIKVEEKEIKDNLSSEATDTKLDKLNDIKSKEKQISDNLLHETEVNKSESIAGTGTDKKPAVGVPFTEVKAGDLSENEKSFQRTDSDIDPAFFTRECKKIDFKDKLFLAPLTTVGNLPFRRICKEFGADITCSEMAVALSLLQGQQSEWALLKRHRTEDIFGIQLCGPHPDVMTRCSQLLSEKTSFDFIDLNLGCPLDAIYKKGAGCGLMNRMKKLHGMIYGITSVTDKPLTVKMRTGIYGHDNLAHNVIKKIHEWGDKVALITLHGRSREQRYTKSADWDYIDTCARIAAPIPLFGNGDILSYEDYNLRRAQTGVSGAMLARGALIKPWIFKEIKEQTHLDVSSTERFDILRKFTNYGLEHWGSDTEGVEKTRRFLLEWLSFLYRYIPVGLLERVPQRINERPPAYFGRNDLETLMASPSCSDWIKISEMLLGPVPESFIFLPKHKANAYK